MNQASKNFYTNIIHLVVNVVVGLLYTPYLVHQVGIHAYGIVPLALIVNQYINVLSLSLVNALSRFYSVAYRAGDYNKASSYLTTSILLCVIVSIILMPLLLMGVNHIDSFFDIPKELLHDAKELFLFTIISFLLSIVSNCFNTTLFSDNYLDWINYIKIIRHVSKISINIVLFTLLGANIVFIGVANFLSELLVLIISIGAFYKTKPRLIHFGLSRFEIASIFAMASMILWVIVQRLADVFLYKVDTIFMNLYFGIDNTGIIGAISEFGSYAISLTGVFSSLLGPLLLISYSNKDFTNYKSMTIQGAYIVCIICSLVCGLLIGSARSILTVWLGQNYGEYGIWLSIKLVAIPFTTCGAVFANSYLYANYNKVPAITSLIISIINILVTYAFLSFFSSIEGFLIICLCFVLLQGFFMNFYFFRKLYHVAKKSAYLLFVKTLLYMSIVALLTWACTQIIPSISIYTLVLTYIIVAIISLILLDRFFIPDSYRAFLYELIPVYQTVRSALIRKKNE